MEIESTDVIRLIQQFLKENNLLKTLECIKEETNVYTNTVDSIDNFTSNILNGHWDIVLQSVSDLKFSIEKLTRLYEHIYVELLEMRENNCARNLLRNSYPFSYMEKNDNERFVRLENLSSYFDASEAYHDGLQLSKEKRRQLLAQELSKDIYVVQPSRLLTLLNQSLRWQKKEGMIIPGTSVDLFRGKSIIEKNAVEHYPTKLHRIIKLSSSKKTVETAKFSPDGQYLITGSFDGTIEVWNFITGRLRKDLKYQMEKDYMKMNNCILSLTFTSDSELLGSGDDGGDIVIWKLDNGQPLKKIRNAHMKGITSLQFSLDSQNTLSASFDMNIRLYSVRNGRLLKEFRGHTSFVNDASFLTDDSYILSCSADSTCRLWNIRSNECVNTFYDVGQAAIVSTDSINQIDSSYPTTNNSIISIHQLPEEKIDETSDNNNIRERFVVCTKSSTVHIIDTNGRILNSLSSGKVKDGDFFACTISPKGDWLYCLAEDKRLYCFSLKSYRLEHTMEVHENNVIGLHHHPFRNLIVTYAEENIMKLWSSDND
ncbi:hypothetical protein SNEBB_005621 [Seison nebaliae]|nr:hypothetical protein SNEBB_005621 [Seison nebaliae]